MPPGVRSQTFVARPEVGMAPRSRPVPRRRRVAVAPAQRLAGKIGSSGRASDRRNTRCRRSTKSKRYSSPSARGCDLSVAHRQRCSMARRGADGNWGIHDPLDRVGRSAWNRRGRSGSPGASGHRRAARRNCRRRRDSRVTREIGVAARVDRRANRWTDAAPCSKRHAGGVERARRRRRRRTLLPRSAAKSIASAVWA